MVLIVFSNQGSRKNEQNAVLFISVLNQGSKTIEKPCVFIAFRIREAETLKNQWLLLPFWIGEAKTFKNDWLLLRFFDPTPFPTRLSGTVSLKNHCFRYFFESGKNLEAKTQKTIVFLLRFRSDTVSDTVARHRAATDFRTTPGLF